MFLSFDLKDRKIIKEHKKSNLVEQQRNFYIMNVAWIFLRIKLHPFSRRNAILLYPLYAVGYWKISNDPESRSVEVTRGRKVMIGWDTKRIASSGHYFTVRFNARWEIPFSAIFSIPVVFESIFENCNNKTDIEKLNASLTRPIP